MWKRKDLIIVVLIVPVALMVLKSAVLFGPPGGGFTVYAAAPVAAQSDATSLRRGSAGCPRRLLAVVADFRTQCFTMLCRSMAANGSSLTRIALQPGVRGVAPYARAMLL